MVDPYEYKYLKYKEKYLNAYDQAGSARKPSVVKPSASSNVSQRAIPNVSQSDRDDALTNNYQNIFKYINILIPIERIIQIQGGAPNTWRQPTSTEKEAIETVLQKIKEGLINVSMDVNKINLEKLGFQNVKNDVTVTGEYIYDDKVGQGETKLIVEKTHDNIKIVRKVWKKNSTTDVSYQIVICDLPNHEGTDN